ncbi:MAG: hypothetical protein JJ895_01260 [Balneolaceae bacterium]|nr:hypothetical protein [Balneolaceae bacterium]
MSKQVLKEQLDRHIQRITTRIIKIEQLSSRLSTIRIAYFLSSILLLFVLSSRVSDLIFICLLVVLIAGFFVLVDRHQKTEASKKRFEELLRIKKEHIARMHLNWNEIPSKNLPIEEKEHPFAQDLDLLGEHSVFHLLDTSIFQESALTLKSWLLNERPNVASIKKRQANVKELVPLHAFRDKLRVIGAITKSDSRNDWSNLEMLEWLRIPAKEGVKKSLIILSVLAALNFLFLGLMLARIISPLFLMSSLVAYLLYYKFTDKLYAGLFDAAFNIEKILNRFKGILMHLERFQAKKDSNLAEILDVYQSAEVRPSLVIKKAQKLMTRAALQANEILWLIVNVCVPWDMYHAWKIERLKASIEPKITKWLNTFYELEALNSLANFAMLNPEYSWPEIDSNSDTLFASTALGHPLIPGEQRVTNDFTVHEHKDLFLITGSNMAGKSTFLRTVGVNLILTFAGAPVCATSLNTRPFRVFSSINITDSLDDGYSHFYTEVRRLRYLLDELLQEDSEPLFFLVDEIYRGTNNRERYVGSAAFLKEVAGKNGVGLVSSHDLELAELEKEIPQMNNLHFVESIKDQKMSFEYILREGPCPSTNALEIMKMEGLPT